MPDGTFRPIEKPGRRRRDRKAHAKVTARLWCEWCGCYAGPGVSIEGHHVKTRGAGGDDGDRNELALCVGVRSKHCHRRAHSGEIPLEDLRRRLRDLTRPAA